MGGMAMLPSEFTMGVDVGLELFQGSRGANDVVEAFLLPDGALELMGGGLSAVVEFVPPWLQAAGRGFQVDQFLCGEAFP